LASLLANHLLTHHGNFDIPNKALQSIFTLAQIHNNFYIQALCLYAKMNDIALKLKSDFETIDALEKANPASKKERAAPHPATKEPLSFRAPIHACLAQLEGQEKND